MFSSRSDIMGFSRVSFNKSTVDIEYNDFEFTNTLHAMTCFLCTVVSYHTDCDLRQQSLINVNKYILILIKYSTLILIYK